jgi:hypothetical protein
MRFKVRILRATVQKRQKKCSSIFGANCRVTNVCLVIFEYISYFCVALYLLALIEYCNLSTLLVAIIPSQADLSQPSCLGWLAPIDLSHMSCPG